MLIMSKNRKKVPLLIMPHVTKAIDLIIKHRNRFVLEGNPYVFGMHNTTNKSYLGWTALKQITKTLSLENAEAITSTKIRKYVASSSQVL